MKTLRIGPLFIPLMRQVYASIDDAADEAIRDLKHRANGMKSGSARRINGHKRRIVRSSPDEEGAA